MAAAYASLVSLLNTMDQIQIHPLLSTSLDNYQNESLREKVNFLVEFVENYSDADSKEDHLVRRIADVAHEAEDIIEVHAAHRIRAEKSPSFLPDLLQRIIQGMDSIKKNVIKAKEETGFITRQYPTSFVPPPSSSDSSPPTKAKTPAMVGFDGYLEQLLDELTGHHSGRKILPIVGMGGIGKTTLARNAYDNLLTVEHFNIRVWVTVSQEFHSGDILVQALCCLGRSTSKMDRSDDEVGEELRKLLFGRRYLIVLDDVWSVEAWDKIKFYFPDNNNGSRIVVTTRQSEVVDHFGSYALGVKLLDDENSWELFCEKTFAQQEGCPPELEQVGKKIVDKCRGLPLAITVIGGLLGKSPRTQVYWEKIAQDKSLILDEQLSILNLSYKHMPVWLKPCLLYLGLFPEDHRIDVSQLIKLWVAEGFIKPKSNQSLEEVAESYLKELVGRNLVLVGELRLNKKLETCYVHDLVRELCIRIGEKENYFCVQRGVDGKRQFIVDARTATFYHRGDSHTPSIVRPLIIDDGQREAPFKSRLLRVLLSVDTDPIDDIEFAFGEVNLRFLYHTIPYSSMFESSFFKIPTSISQLWSLQTLIIDEVMLDVAVPHEIWKMPQLRHIRVYSICLPDPPPSDDHDAFVLQNLQTLTEVMNLSLSEEVCKRIPNVKELGMIYFYKQGKEASWCKHVQNLGCLNKLESLSYYMGPQKKINLIENINIL